MIVMIGKHWFDLLNLEVFTMTSLKKTHM